MLKTPIVSSACPANSLFSLRSHRVFLLTSSSSTRACQSPVFIRVANEPNCPCSRFRLHGRPAPFSIDRQHSVVSCTNGGTQMCLKPSSLLASLRSWPISMHRSATTRLKSNTSTTARTSFARGVKSTFKINPRRVLSHFKLFSRARVRRLANETNSTVHRLCHRKHLFQLLTHSPGENLQSASRASYRCFRCVHVSTCDE